MKKTYCIDVGGPTSAIALNKQSNQVAVVGRSVFKIYSIGDKEFEEVSNLRVVKNVNSSCNDVAWNQDDENILASAASNGAIVIWNLSKPGFSKMDQVFQDHKRTVNKICFHNTEASLLVSGSQDSIKLFDLRLSEAVVSFSGLSESVRDLQFSPHRPNTFVAVLDNGYIQLYDIRKKDRYEQSFPGHNGPILACDWHPDSMNVFATAGRDMSIKVWSVNGSTSSLQHHIPTMESVSKIKWTYENKNFIASCSLKRDFSINVWDVNRPYIASARFTEPKEVTIGMAWRWRTSNLISSSKDGVLYQLSIADAHRPVEHANPVGIAFNPDGDIALALGNGLLRSSMNSSSNSDLASMSNSTVFSKQLSQQSTSSGQISTLTANKFSSGQAAQSRASSASLCYQPGRRMQSPIARPKISNRSQLDVYKSTEMNWFVKTAQEYQLANRPLAELCDHNAKVCAKLRRFQVCQTWKILKLFYANIPNNTATITSANQSYLNIGVSAAASKAGGQAGGQQEQQLGADQVSISSQATGRSEFSHISKTQVSKFNIFPTTDSKPTTSLLNESLAGNEMSADESEKSEDASSDEWLQRDTLSYEAFQPKHEIIGRVERGLIDLKAADRSLSSSPSSNFDEDFSTLNQTAMKSVNITRDNESNIRSLLAFNTNSYQFKFYEIIADVIADVLKCHVDNSDVQSAVSILIVLGDRIKNIVDERIPEVDRESWYYSYIDLLSKFQLWNVMAQVINLSPLQDINSINQTSTTIYTTCGSCQRPLNGKVSWICDKCQTRPSECSICHGVVAGLMSWCQGCYHGGHLVHMSQWFNENDYCPTGCGHLCELGQWRQASNANCLC